MSVVKQLARGLAAFAIGATLAGCGGDHPVPPRGPVLRHDHMPLIVTVVPMSCGKGCMTRMPIVNPERWTVTVQDEHNPSWTGTVDVDPPVYSKCDRPKVWPDCWKDADVR